MKHLIILFFISFTLLCCKKSETICGCEMPYQIYYLKAKVVSTSDISCHKPILDFSEDSVRIRSITNQAGLSCLAINLPASFNATGKTIYVSVQQLKSEEEFVCNTVGIAMPHINVIDAKNRE